MIKDPFDFEPDDYYKPTKEEKDDSEEEDDESFFQSLKFINLADPESNLDPDELALYMLVIAFAVI